MLRYDAMSEGETNAVSRSLGRKEWDKNPFQVSLWNSFSGIYYLNHRPLAPIIALHGSHDNYATLQGVGGYCLSRVPEKIQQCLTQHSFVRTHHDAFFYR